MADLREIYWIEFYDSYNNGYNSTKGGDVGNGGMLGEENPRAVLNNKEVLQIRLLKSEMLILLMLLVLKKYLKYIIVVLVQFLKL